MNELPTYVTQAPPDYSREKLVRDGTAIWSGADPPPEIEEEITVDRGGLVGRVLDYFVEHGFLGVVVQIVRNDQQMFAGQAGDDLHLFGCEIDR